MTGPQERSSIFQLTEAESELYKQKGYSNIQIEKVRHIIQILALDAKLFSGRTSSIDKMSRNKLLADLKACRLDPNKPIYWKRHDLDRRFFIGEPEKKI
jgi:hypothetical protein